MYNITQGAHLADIVIGSSDVRVVTRDGTPSDFGVVVVQVTFPDTYNSVSASTSVNVVVVVDVDVSAQLLAQLSMVMAM